MKDTLLLMLTELNERITTENLEREESGALKLSPVEIRILGQVSLLANELVAKVLPLQMTNEAASRGWWKFGVEKRGEVSRMVVSDTTI